MVGGVSGILTGLWGMYQFLSNSNWLTLLFIPFIFLYFLSILAGIYLWKDKPRGFILSIIIQAIQIPQFTLGGLLYYFCSGLELSPRLFFHDNGGGFNFKFWFGGNFLIKYAPQSSMTMIGINLFALFAFTFLLTQKKKLFSSNNNI